MAEFQLPHQHGEKNIQSIRNELTQVERFSTTAEVFRQLSDTTRLQIFWLLCHQEECVINIAALLGISSPAASHHLRTLHESGLLHSRREGKEVYYSASDTEVTDLLHRTMEEVMNIACPRQAVDYSASPEEIVCSVHAYLLEHLGDRITISDLSKRFLMNPTTLKTVFKRVYGTSLAAHVKQHRMEKAAEQLRRTDLRISQIALSVGYESQSRFTTAFQEAYGMLPSAYRRENREPALREEGEKGAVSRFAKMSPDGSGEICRNWKK